MKHDFLSLGLVVTLLIQGFVGVKVYVEMLSSCSLVSLYCWRVEKRSSGGIRIIQPKSQFAVCLISVLSRIEILKYDKDLVGSVHFIVSDEAVMY